MTYSPTAVGLDAAELDVVTDAGTTAVTLSGIGTAGLGGVYQPSLERILRAYGLPNYAAVGESDETNAKYPEPPAAGSTEVDLQQMVKAGPGDVTVTPIASFVAEAATPYLLYWYGTAAGPAASGQLLFHTVQPEYQTVDVHPVGTTSFDPGTAAFGFYTPSQTVRVNGQLVTGYTQDALNTYDPTDARKFRFFPYVDAAGTAVPDTYLMTSTEWYAPVGYDFTNLVAIVSNVRPAAPVAVADTAAATAGAATAIDVTANDAATTGALAGVAITTAPASGGTATADPVTGVVSYTAPAGFSGTDTFAYTVANTAGYTSAPATVTVAVASAQTPAPPLVALSTTTTVGTPVTVNALSAVSDPATAVASSVRITTSPAAGNVATANADGTVTFTPAAAFVGPDAFACAVDDAAGQTSTVVVTVDVGVPVGTGAGDRRSVAVGGATVTLNRGTALVVPAVAGTVAVDKAGRATVAGSPAIASITLSGTTAASRLTIGGAAAATIADVTAAAAVGAIVAPRATLAGNVSLAAINSIAVAAVTGADLTATSIGALTVRGAIANATLTTTGTLGRLSAASLGGDVVHVAATLGALRTSAFSGTTVIAHTLTTAALGTVATTAGGGVTVAATRSITGTADGKRFRVKTSQAFGTFAVQVG